MDNEYQSASLVAPLRSATNWGWVFSRACTPVEFAHNHLRYERERQLRVSYKQTDVGVFYADFVVEGRLMVELKAMAGLAKEHEAQVMNYLRASGITAGLLLNFGTPKMGIKRIVLRHDDTESI